MESYNSSDFLAIFRRFTSVRDECWEIYSDNGTTFVAASKEISELFIKVSDYIKEIIYALKFDNVKWHFIPPSAPNFGGIWKAAVKSAKLHLKKVLGDQILTFSHFYTLLKQVEACFNSRPLLPLNDDISGVEILSPF